MSEVITVGMLKSILSNVPAKMPICIHGDDYELRFVTTGDITKALWDAKTQFLQEDPGEFVMKQVKDNSAEVTVFVLGEN